MFSWIKKLVARKSAANHPVAQPNVLPPDDLRMTLQVASVWQVVDRFLTRNPTPTAFGVHALVEAGASNLLDGSELMEACEKIREHGYQFPINPTLMNELGTEELLEFVRWHGQHRIDQEYYANEATLRELIDRFRMNS